MSERVILISGANSGIGLAIAEAFLNESTENVLWLGVHRNAEGVRALAERYPGRCHSATLDVTDPESWSRVMREITTSAGRLDVLVNNAGTHRDELLATMRREVWDGVLGTNLNGVFNGCQAVLQTMIAQRKGRIINIGSLSGLLAPPGQANYAAAKAGVIALTQSVAKEVARIGITVNVVCPGYIETGALAEMTPEQMTAAKAKVPMRRFGRPEEVAAAVRFLASDEASYITGSVLKVDGGIL